MQHCLPGLGRLFRWSAALVLGCAVSLGTQAAATADPSTDGLPPRTVPEYLQTPAPPEWLQKNIRVGHLPGGLIMPAEYLKSGYNVVTINVCGSWDRVGPGAVLYTPEEVKAAEDYLRGHVEMCHKAGAKAIFYMGPVQVAPFSKEFVAAHPDWLRVRSNGKIDPVANFSNIRSGYADWLLAQLEYVTKTFGNDGYWFDGYAPVHLHTYDKATKQAFREFSGGKEIPLPLEDDPDKPMYFDPANDPVAKLYMQWHEQNFVQFAAKMREAVRRGNPEAVIYVNHSANRTWYFPNMYMGEYPMNYASSIDVASVELYWDVPGDPLYQQFVFAFMQGMVRDRDASYWIQPAAHGISGIAPKVEMQLRGLEGTPWGVYPEFVESTGREEYKDIHVKNIIAREQWLSDTKPLSYIGVVVSEQTRTLYAQGALPIYFSHTLGAFRSFLEKHLPVRILNEYDLEDAKLQGVKVLVMPNVACLSDRAAEVVRRFVEAGGGLVASFETSLYDENFKKRENFALADLFKAKYLETHKVSMRTENLYLTLDDYEHPIVADPLIREKQSTAWTNPGNPPNEKGNLALIASGVGTEVQAGGTVVSTYNTNDPATNTQRFPAIIASEYGKGRVVYFAASVDKAMFFYPDTYMRQMLANAAKWAAHDEKPLAEVEGPLMLTTTFRTQPISKRTIVHLLNNCSSYGIHSIYQKLAPLPEELSKQFGFPDQSELRGTYPVREEVIPIHDIKVTCRVAGVTKATQQPENIDLPLTRTDDGVTVIVPKVEMHSMVVFE